MTDCAATPAAQELAALRWHGSPEDSDGDRLARAGRALAALRWNYTDQDARRQATAAGRARFMETFEALVDPDGTLDETERKVRAAELRRAYFSNLGRRGVAARRRKRLEGLAPDRDVHGAQLVCAHVWPAELDHEATCGECHMSYSDYVDELSEGTR